MKGKRKRACGGIVRLAESRLARCLLSASFRPGCVEVVSCDKCEFFFKHRRWFAFTVGQWSCGSPVRLSYTVVQILSC